MSRLQKIGNWLRNEVQDIEPDVVLTSLGAVVTAAVLALSPTARETAADTMAYAVETIVGVDETPAPQPLTPAEYLFVEHGADISSDVPRVLGATDCPILPDVLC